MLYKNVAQIIAKGCNRYEVMQQKGNSTSGDNKKVGILNKQDDPQLTNANNTLRRIKPNSYDLNKKHLMLI